MKFHIYQMTLNDVIKELIKIRKKLGGNATTRTILDKQSKSSVIEIRRRCGCPKCKERKD